MEFAVPSGCDRLQVTGDLFVRIIVARAGQGRATAPSGIRHHRTLFFPRFAMVAQSTCKIRELGCARSCAYRACIRTGRRRAQVTDQTSRSGRLLAGSLGAALAACGHPKFYRYGEVLLVISPEHADAFKHDGFSKAQVRSRIQEVSAKRIRDLLPDNETGEGMPLARFGITGRATEAQLNQRIEKVP